MVALVRSIESAEPEPALDRRIFGRCVTHFQVEARRLDHSIRARRQPRIDLDVRDLSLGGLSGIASLPVEEGEHISIFFPQRGRMPAWNGFGRVTRCEPSALGYRVALEFDPLPAA